MNLKKGNFVYSKKLREFVKKHPEVKASKGMISANEHMWELLGIAVSDRKGSSVLDHKIIKLLHDAVRISFYFSLQGNDAITLSTCTFNNGEREASLIYFCAFGIDSGIETTYIN